MISTGSVQKRGKYSWLLTVNTPDGTGKRQRHTKTIKVEGDDPEKQEKQANHQLSLFIREVETGQNATSGKMTLNEFFEYWSENYAEGRHAPKTISYNKGLFKRIKQAMGNMRLDKVAPKHLLAFYNNLAEPGIRQDPNESRRKIKPDAETADIAKPKKDTLSPNTIRKYHVLLHSLFEKATQWQLIAYNPAEKVEPPKTHQTHKTIYDEETTGRFLMLLEQEELRHRVMALLSLSTGMRRGELFGLQWKHIDTEKSTVLIEQSSQYLPEKGIFQKDPKNKSSKRLITIPASVVALAMQYKAEQLTRRLKLGGTVENGGKWAGAEEPEDDFIFTTWNGQPAHPDSINTWLKDFIEVNGLPHITPHSFRHMAATYLISSGTDLRTVAGKLGHANSTTTQIVYSHLLKSAEKETADKMESFLKSTTDKAKEQQKKQAK